MSTPRMSPPTPPPPTPTPHPPPTPPPSPTPPPRPPASPPAPAPAPSAPSLGTATWMSLVNVAQSGTTLTKVGGCSGCPDGTAVSNQQVSGSGLLQFSTDDSTSLRFVGL